ncbi:MAG: HPr-rel-A system PqqD family peptide chaperone [Massilia sp.]
MWRVVPGQALLHRGWDDEYVLYNNLSGDTHLLDASAIELLLLLQRAPAGLASLTAALRGPDDLDDEPALAAAIGATLDALCQLSLVETAT